MNRVWFSIYQSKTLNERHRMLTRTEKMSRTRVYHLCVMCECVTYVNHMCHELESIIFVSYVTQMCHELESILCVSYVMHYRMWIGTEHMSRTRVYQMCFMCVTNVNHICHELESIIWESYVSHMCIICVTN